MTYRCKSAPTTVAAAKMPMTSPGPVLGSAAPAAGVGAGVDGAVGVVAAAKLTGLAQVALVTI